MGIHHLPYNLGLQSIDTTLYCNCDQASNLWQQIQLAIKPEPHNEDPANWDRDWLAC